MLDWLHDVRYTARVLARTPGFATVAILSLALGIGANTAIYSVVRAVLQEPLPVPDPDQLMVVTQQWTPPASGRGTSQINATDYSDPATGRNYRSNISYPIHRAFRQAASDSADVFAFTFVREVNISIDNQAVMGSGALVSGNYFRGLGVTASIGRTLTDEDDRPDAAPVAVIGDRLWTRAFGRDPAIVGRAIRINGAPVTIVGVSAPGFFGVSKGGFFPSTDVSMPLAAQPAVSPQWSTPARSLFTAENVWWLQSMARMKPNASVAQVQAALTTTFAQQLKASTSRALQQAGSAEVRLLPGKGGVNALTQRVERPLLILTGVVAIVLLIACVNLANLMLARGMARQKEISIRLALGSGPLRLARQVLTESVMLSAAGGAVGLSIGVICGRLLLTMLTASSGGTPITIEINWRLAAMAAIVSGLATLVFGLVPAFRLAHRDAATALKQFALGGNPPRLGAGRILMAVQVAISVPLLVGAGLFLRTIHNLERVQLGFNPERLILFRIDPALNGYSSDRVERVYADVLRKVEAIPGITSASLVQEVLLSGWSSNTDVTVGGAGRKNMYFNRVGPRYFETMGVPIVAGRAIGIQDHSQAPPVAVINETAVRVFFDGAWPIGRRIRSGSNELEVIGIAKDSKYDNLRKAVEPTMFLPYAQNQARIMRPLHVIARTAIEPGALTKALRAAVAEVDPSVPVTAMKTQQAQITESLGAERVFARLLVVFGLFALFLASIGLHGVTAYSVARRTSEIGVRIALGAQRRDVLWLVLRQVVVIMIVGLIVGVPAAVVASRLIASFLFGVQPGDPASVVTAGLILSSVAVLAGFLPARRAARLDPLTALRHE